MKRNVFPRILRLDVVHVPAHEAALNEQQILFKIEVFPLERRDLADAKTEALCNNHHRSVRFLQECEDGVELLHSQHSGALPPFRAVLDPNDLYGVPAIVEEFPASCTLKMRCITPRIWAFNFGPYPDSSTTLRPPSDGSGAADSAPTLGECAA